MPGPHTLAETERTVEDRIAGLKIDYDAMNAVLGMFRAANASRNHIVREVLAPAGLTWTAFLTLWISWIWGSAETRIIAEEAGISKATLSGVLNTLENRGLINRLVDKKDKRLVLISLTPAGTRMIKKLFPLVNHEESFIVRDFTKKQQSEIADYMRGIFSAVEESGSEQD